MHEFLHFPPLPGMCHPCILRPFGSQGLKFPAHCVCSLARRRLTQATPLTKFESSISIQPSASTSPAPPTAWTNRVLEQPTPERHYSNKPTWISLAGVHNPLISIADLAQLLCITLFTRRLLAHSHITHVIFVVYSIGTFAPGFDGFCG